jgi:CheY-like chemotaxis protein
MNPGDGRRCDAGIFFARDGQQVSQFAAHDPHDEEMAVAPEIKDMPAAMINLTMGRDRPRDERLERAAQPTRDQSRDEAALAQRTPRGRSRRLAADPFPSLDPVERPITILVVDDEPSIAELLCELLDSAGYRSLRASNARTALAIARRERPALVLSDRNMPEVDGIELVRRLRASAVTNAIPVMLMSSTRPDLEAVGNVPFLAKPFDLDDVLRAVAAHADTRPRDVCDLDGLAELEGLCGVEQHPRHTAHHHKE